MIFRFPLGIGQNEKSKKKNLDLLINEKTICIHFC